MTEQKPTPEQLERAARTAYNALPGADWCEMSIAAKQRWERSMCLAAPHLQIAWEMPSEEEIERACRGWGGVTHTAIRFELIKFVAKRNHDLVPQPPDPRREKIKQAVIKTYCDSDFDGMVDAILAALEEQ